MYFFSEKKILLENKKHLAMMTGASWTKGAQIFKMQSLIWKEKNTSLT